jgi:hypothetical protein
MRIGIWVGCAVLFAHGLHAQVDAVVPFTSSNLPIIVINTNGVSVPDDPKITADMGIIFNGSARNNLSDPFNSYSGKIGIEVRGSSSQSFPKKQYGIELRDNSGNGITASLLTLPEEEDWILFAPYNDKSLMRDALAYALGRSLGSYAPRTKFCELVLNGVYQGIYVLMEKIKRDKNRLDINKLDPTEITGNDVTGGYIIKIDKTTGGNGEGWYSAYRPPKASSQQILFLYDYPKPEDIVPEQKSYIQNYVAKFENALAGNNFDDPEQGYAKYIDVNSFVDFFIMQEISKNVDGYRLSTFFHKQRDSDGGKLVMGPIWDFNLAFGNADYCTRGNPEGFVIDFNTVCNDDYWLIPFWWKRLLQDVTFTEKLAARWTALRASKLQKQVIHAYIDSVASVLNEESQQRNFKAWNVLNKYVWPNYFIGSSFQSEVDWLKGWVGERLDWLDQNMPLLITDVGEDVEPDEGVSVFPNPFSNQISFEYRLERPGSVTLRIFDSLGRVVLEDNVHHDTTGSFVYSWQANGTNGLYFYSFQQGTYPLGNGKISKK